MKSHRAAATLLLVLTMSAVAAEDKPPWAVPTFECLSLYCPSAADRGECSVRYHHADEANWHAALPLVYDARERQYRGSLVNLKPNTTYFI